MNDPSPLTAEVIAVKKRLMLLSWGAHPLNIIGGQAVDKLVADTKQCIDRLLADLAAAKAEWNELNAINKTLEVERNAALASSEADRAALTRCLATQRRIEAAEARLTKALAKIALIYSIGPNIGAAIEIARAALAAEGGET